MNLILGNEYNFLIPYSVPMIRLGNLHDGGYVIAEQSLQAKNLISLGLGTNWSFDKHWSAYNYNCHIHGYDSTIFPNEFPTKLKAEYDSFFTGNIKHFSKNASRKNIGNILHRMPESAFLKMDIEGGEYDLIDPISKSENLIGMVIEFHTLDFKSRRADIRNAVNMLDKYRIVHLHANNGGGVCDDNLPHTIEISFLRKELCSDKQRYDVYLKGLDSPNSAFNKEEYMLSFNKKKTDAEKFDEQVVMKDEYYDMDGEGDTTD